MYVLALNTRLNFHKIIRFSNENSFSGSDLQDSLDHCNERQPWCTTGSCTVSHLRWRIWSDGDWERVLTSTKVRRTAHLFLSKLYTRTGGTPPLILYLNGQRPVLAALCQERSRWTRGWVGPTAGPHFFALSELEPRTVHNVARSLYELRYPGPIEY